MELIYGKSLAKNLEGKYWMSTAQQFKELADKLYKEGKYLTSIAEYTHAINSIKSSSNRDDELLYICYSNRCASFLRLKRYPEAINDARYCINLKQNWPKGHLRLGKAMAAMNRKEEATAAFQQVLLLDPNNKEAQEGLSKLNSSSSSSHETNENQQRATNQQTNSWSTLLNTLKKFAFDSYYYLQVQWMSLSDENRKYIMIGLILAAVYYFFFYRGSYYYDDYHYYDDYSYTYGNRGLSWTSWSLIMLAAYKLPQMFPEVLGEQYARPFFGMNWTTFMWLLNMFSRNSGTFIGGGNPFYNRRRRYY